MPLGLNLFGPRYGFEGGLFLSDHKTVTARLPIETLTVDGPLYVPLQAAANRPTRPVVSQAFCSALPVAYSRLPAPAWARFARLVLEAAYEATLLEAVLNARRGGSPVVLLTRLGGGAFGNDDAWIDDALVRAVECVGGPDLDVRVVSYRAPTPSLRAIARRFAAAPVAGSRS